MNSLNCLTMHTCLLCIYKMSNLIHEMSNLIHKMSNLIHENILVLKAPTGHVKAAKKFYHNFVSTSCLILLPHPEPNSPHF